MIPAHMQPEYDALSEFHKQKFAELISWSNAGQPGQILMSDMAIAKIIEQVRRIEAPPVEVIEALPEEAPSAETVIEHKADTAESKSE